MESKILRERLSVASRSSRRTSTQFLKKSLTTDYLINPNLKAQTFIPFFKERDGMNKLINFQETEETPKTRTLYTPTPNTTTKRRRLIKKVTPIYPTIGSYNLQDSWIKRSFSVKKLTQTQNLEEMSLTKNLEKNINKSFQTGKARIYKYNIENAIDSKAKRINVQRKLGIWERLKIYGTPEEIKEELRFTQQKNNIKQYQCEIKNYLNELKR
ncbi:hypothetical protein SteCoe_9496 [Stentor coeruleus]|uniref:Uncharacterized protein n=1 Tax=Stentor coeruleus TaxID=5963 RepID=A0A1R2CHM4_9CILI|nr:hypothetical protein SteCoe_9496 [Stentor coeruleus]